MSVHFDNKLIRPWTIQDTKDGDVLYSIDSKQPFIYKERPQFSQAKGYCCINKFGEFAIWNTSKCVICTDKYIPATKEQCELLFSKMREAGYEWDANKKELKKVEQKPIEWSEDDYMMIGTLINIFEVNYSDSFYEVNPIGTTNMQGINSYEIIKWLKSLKQRIAGKEE